MQNLENKQIWLNELVEFDDFCELPYHELPSECFEIFKSIKYWVDTYLTKTHPELGRSGAVCPFVRASIVKKTFYLTAIYSQNINLDVFAQQLEEWKKKFLNLHPTTGHNTIYRTIVILFPELTDAIADKLFIDVMNKCKTSFVQSGLMLGEFHGGPPDKYSLHNPNFKPLISPLPLLVIREMAPTDIEFLKESEDHYQAYVQKFGYLINKHDQKIHF